MKVAKFSLVRPDGGEAIAVAGYPARSAVLVTTSGAIASSWEVDEKDLHPLGTPDWALIPSLSDSYLADVHVNPGNSGGPVFSVANGSVIGVCVSFHGAYITYADGHHDLAKVDNRYLWYNSAFRRWFQQSTLSSFSRKTT